MVMDFWQNLRIEPHLNSCVFTKGALFRHSSEIFLNR